ncbi:MAG: molybdopterin-synthase adenylyltransferase MoeB [Nitrososphaerales archaeon]|nr:molybdopterin-synthase adenylyltransferase MoeB [Nitrososphaerales archaeon]
MPGLSDSEKVRYSRHLVMPEVGAEGQRRFKGSSVVVVGAGGLGIPAAVYLAAAGVGRIGVVDGDVVELSNLHRQFLFSEADMGRPKAELVRSRLLAINPNIRVDARRSKLDSSNALEILGGYDIVVDATDNFPSRYLVNDACVLLGKPDVYASVFRFDGQASVFATKDGPCYRCLYPEPPPSEAVQSCAEAGVLGVVTGIIGAVQANQAIAIILGKGPSLAGRLLLFNGLDTSFNELRIKKSPGCPACGPNPSITKLIDYEVFCGTKMGAEAVEGEIDPAGLKALIDTGPKPFLLDVREPLEYQVCRLEGAKLLPLDQLRKRVNELDKAGDIVVYCKTGDRSVKAVRLLRDAGFSKVRNLKGGIKAWADQVDPSMPMY